MGALTMTHRAIACIAMLLLIAASPGLGEVQEKTSAYTVGAIIAISCSGEPHNIAPIGDPLEDPTTIDHWLFSGEPECAPSDALNLVMEATGEERRPWGIAGVHHFYTYEEVDTLAIATTDDGLAGPDASPLRLQARSDEGSVVVEGCGSQMMVLPEYTPHWQPWPPPPMVWWALTDAVHVEPDLTTCFGSTGTLHAQWGL
jgi:hypothetical protein